MNSMQLHRCLRLTEARVDQGVETLQMQDLAVREDFSCSQFEDDTPFSLQ